MIYYLIIQVDNNQPSVMPFKKMEQAQEYARVHLNNPTIAWVTANVGFCKVRSYEVRE